MQSPKDPVFEDLPIGQVQSLEEQYAMVSEEMNVDADAKVQLQLAPIVVMEFVVDPVCTRADGEHQCEEYQGQERQG